VELAAQHIDGTILAPGETFSYNDTVGPRTTKRGWLDAPTFLDGQVVPSPGGGVCQVSTTLYNAVLRAGLGIVQRSHHSMAVHYVEPGRDATVAYGNIDFRFRNTTPAPVLVAASTKGGRLTFSLYGAAPDAPQQISLASSAHTPRADGGFSVTTFRVVQRGEEPAVRETLSTDTYAPPPSKAHPTKPKPAPPRPIADKRLKSTPLLPSA
jgi:vancomycin resistance protein YoaR